MDGAPTNPSNLAGLDYEAESRRFAPLPGGIVDCHTHIAGGEAARVYRRAARLYGVEETWSMTPWPQVEPVRAVLGDTLRFIAIPDFAGPDRLRAHGDGYLERIAAFHSIGSRIAKFWSAPRGLDLGREAGDPDLLRLDAPKRIEGMALASSLGMVIMAHVADPDTWFATRYADRARYGSKRSHYDPLERLLDRFTGPWLVAHLGGWPEDLDFLDGLLERHPNLALDSSATKWIVRELSRHDPGRRRDFFDRWAGRILFGSDIVTADEHLRSTPQKTEMAAKGNSPEEAFDLYASRYWALRTLFERDIEVPSPIADPDLAMIDPTRHGPLDAPMLRGAALRPSALRWLYRDAARRLLDSVAERQPTVGGPSAGGSPGRRGGSEPSRATDS